MKKKKEKIKFKTKISNIANGSFSLTYGAPIGEVSRMDERRNYSMFRLSSNCVRNIKDKRLKNHVERLVFALVRIWTVGDYE